MTPFLALYLLTFLLLYILFVIFLNVCEILKGILK